MTNTSFLIAHDVFQIVRSAWLDNWKINFRPNPYILTSIITTYHMAIPMPPIKPAHYHLPYGYPNAAHYTCSLPLTIWLSQCRPLNLHTDILLVNLFSPRMGVKQQINTRITKFLVSILYEKRVFRTPTICYSITESQIDIQILNHFWDPLEMKKITINGQFYTR